MFVEGEGGRRFHFQQPIDLLERNGVALGENLIDDRPNISSTLQGPEGNTRKGVNSLHSVIEASVDEGRKMLLDHDVHPFNKNGVLCLKELMTRIAPFFNRLLDEPSRDNKRVIIGELSRFCPVSDLSDRIAKEG